MFSRLFNRLSSRAAKPYLTAVISIVLAALLIAVIYLTRIDQQWITFLLGVLIAAILAFASRAQTEWIIARRSAQLLTSQEKLAQEVKLRQWAEKAATAGKSRLQLVDERFPVMLAYVDADKHCSYHNQAFRKWLGLGPEQIDGQHLRSVLGSRFYGEIEHALGAVMAGKAVHGERTQTAADGSPTHLLEQFIPDSGADGKTAGFYMLHTRIAERTLPAENNRDGAPERPAPPGPAESVQPSGDHADSQVSEWGVPAVRVAQAIEENEFCLYGQTIIPLKTDGGRHHELLIRLTEEEDKLLPPGAFLPLVEKHDMLPLLDRWVVNHLLDWLPAQRQAPGTMFCINVAGDTLSDPAFPDFVRDRLRESGVPAAALCFEIEEADATLRRTDAMTFVSKIRQHGCNVTLCGFGSDRASFDLLKAVKISFLKIDGSLICSMLSSPAALTKVAAINRVAHAIGIQTIAELVESDAVLAKLREIGVDFAQGFGIAKPRPLKELE